MILSTKISIDPDTQKPIKTVLTVGGGKAAVNGDMTNDIAVYAGDPDTSAEDIARTGTKLSHAHTNCLGYNIAEENYRR